MSMIVTSAPKPTPTTHALSPTTPAPMIVTRPRRTPETPGSSNPLPPDRISSDAAPAWIDSRPATSDIGTSSGSVPSGSCTVS